MTIDSKSESSADGQCPLCSGQRSIEVGAIETVPIVNYWLRFQYDLNKEFPNLPSLLLEYRCPDCGLHFFSPSLIGTPELYRTISRQPWYYTRHKWEFSKVLGHLATKNPRRLLELGCGNGEFLSQAQRFCETVQGLESNENAVRYCKDRGLSVSSAELVNITGTFDVITVFQTMEHLPEPGKVISQCLGRLAPDGELIISVPNQDGPLGGLNNDFLNLPPHHATRWEKKCFHAIAEQHDLGLIAHEVEPLTLQVYQAYAESNFEQLSFPGGVRGKLLRRSAMIFHRALVPYCFESAKQNMPGHTHLAIFIKNK